MGVDFNDQSKGKTDDEIVASLNDLKSHKPRGENLYTKVSNSGSNIPTLSDNVTLDLIKPALWQDKAIPERRWLVQDRIPMRQTTLLTGDGGLGKTLLALQLQTACTLGRDWIDLKAEPVKSIGFYCEEEPNELHRRLADILQHYDADFGDLENMRLVGRAGEDSFIASASRNGSLSQTALYDALFRECIDFGAQLVIIDTAADVFDGNEIIRREVRAFISLLQRLAMAIDGAVILCAHPSQAGMNSGRGDSGSTAWHNSVRSRLYLTRPKNADGTKERLATERILRPMKANLAGISDDICLNWEQGVFVAKHAPEGMLKSIEDRNDDSRFLKALDAAAELGRNLSDFKTTQNYAPKILADLKETEHIGRHRLEKAMKRLFDEKRIKIGTVGIGLDRHKKRGIVCVE